MRSRSYIYVETRQRLGLSIIQRASRLMMLGTNIFSMPEFLEWFICLMFDMSRCSNRIESDWIHLLLLKLMVDCAPIIYAKCFIVYSYMNMYILNKRKKKSWFVHKMLLFYWRRFDLTLYTVWGIELCRILFWFIAKNIITYPCCCRFFFLIEL